MGWIDRDDDFGMLEAERELDARLDAADLERKRRREGPDVLTQAVEAGVGAQLVDLLIHDPEFQADLGFVLQEPAERDWEKVRDQRNALARARRKFGLAQDG